MMSVGQEGEKDSPSTTADSIVVAGAWRGEGEGAVSRARRLPVESPPCLEREVEKESNEEEDLSVFHFCDWRRLAFKLSAFRARLQL